jgi:hypothetical protein
MANFDEGYLRSCSAKGVSQELRPLLSVVYNQIHASPVKLTLLKESLVALISFLSQAEHRTDENCKAVDLFFAIDHHWDVRWDRLPEEYKSVLDDIGGCLHDTVSAPKIAENFASTPEQLLERVKQLKV